MLDDHPALGDPARSPGEESDLVAPPEPRFSDVQMVGFSPWTQERIIDAALAGTPVEDIPGDFVLAADRGAAGTGGGRETVIVSTTVSARPYYYADLSDGGGLVHGPELFDLVARAGMPWHWNDDAIRSLAWLRHGMDEETLHRDVRRVPYATVIHHRGGVTTTTRRDPFGDALAGPRGTEEQARDALVAATGDLAGERPLVPLTAGFDSRVLLAALLAAGHTPIVFTAGGPDVTDVVVAAQIARDYGLEHHSAEMDPGDYLRHGPTITRITGGLYPAGDWHSYMLLQAATGLGATRALKGTNGEAARSFYLDYGIAERVADATRLNITERQWARRSARWQAQYRHPIAPLADPAAHAGFARRLTAMSAGPPGTPAQLDRFYTLQRVRGFAGMGMHLTGATIPVCSPFLDARWALAAARLPRRSKLGNAFHRGAIAALDPKLLAYPTGSEPTMARRAPRGAWLRRGYGSSLYDVGHNPIKRVLAAPETQDLLRESTDLDVFATRADRAAIVAAGEQSAMDLLLTLHFAAAAAREATAVLTPPRS